MGHRQHTHECERTRGPLSEAEKEDGRSSSPSWTAAAALSFAAKLDLWTHVRFGRRWAGLRMSSPLRSLLCRTEFAARSPSSSSGATGFRGFLLIELLLPRSAHLRASREYKRRRVCGAPGAPRRAAYFSSEGSWNDLTRYLEGYLKCSRRGCVDVPMNVRMSRRRVCCMRGKYFTEDCD